MCSQSHVPHSTQEHLLLCRPYQLGMGSVQAPTKSVCLTLVQAVLHCPLCRARLCAGDADTADHQDPARVQPGLPAMFGGPISPGPIRVGPRAGAGPQDTGRLACPVPATPWTARFKRQLDTMDPSEWATLSGQWRLCGCGAPAQETGT